MRHVVTLDLLINSALRKEVGEGLPGEEEEGKEEVQKREENLEEDMTTTSVAQLTT